MGLAACENALIFRMIDGARLTSPGLIAASVAAARAHDRAIVYTTSLQIGAERWHQQKEKGSYKAAEDMLFDQIGWPAEGYRLFDISCGFTNSEPDLRWVEPRYGSNALTMQ